MGVLSAMANFSRPSGPGTEGRVRGHGTHIVSLPLKGIPGRYSGTTNRIAYKKVQEFVKHSMEFIEHCLNPRRGTLLIPR